MHLISRFAPAFFVLFCAISVASCTTKKKTSTTSKTPDKVNQEELVLRGKIIDFAKDHKGSKYKYAGRDPKTGFDCSGFTYFALSKFDIKVSPASKVQATEGKPVPLDQVKPGDLVFFSKHGKGGKVTHVAMVVENSEEGIIVVHSTSSRGVIMENISTSDYWKPKTLFARDVISK